MEKIITRIRLAIWLLKGDAIVCYNKKTRLVLGAITDEGTIMTNLSDIEFVSKDNIIKKKFKYYVKEEGK